MKSGWRKLARAIAPMAALAVAAPLTAQAGSDSTPPAAGVLGFEYSVVTPDALAAADRSAEFHYAISVSFNTWDPHRRIGGADKMYMAQVYDRLLTTVNTDDGRVEIGPQLASSYEVAADGLSIDFELRDDVTFQDGTTFDADAVKANIERAQAEESTIRSLVESVESVEVVDPTHVVFHLSGPDPGLLWALAFDTAGMMVSPAAFDSDLSSTPVGSGPFTLVSAQKDAEAVFERWDDHWDPDAALVSRLVMTTITDSNAMFNGIRAGEYHAGFLGAPHDAESRALIDEGYLWRGVNTNSVNGVMLNSDRPPFDDPRARRAVSMAIDRAQVSDALFGGIQPPAYQPFAPGVIGYDPSLDVDPYDPDGARALIEEAGADGAHIQVIQTVSSVREQSLGQVVQQALTDIGLDVELIPMAGTESRAAWREGGHHAFVGAILGQFDPSQTLETGYLGFDNPATPPAELVDMAGAARALPPGSDEREAAYQEISRYLVDNPVQVPLTLYSSVHLARPEVVIAVADRLTAIDRLDFRGVGLASG